MFKVGNFADSGVMPAVREVATDRNEFTTFRERIVNVVRQEIHKVISINGNIGIINYMETTEALCKFNNIMIANFVVGYSLSFFSGSFLFVAEIYNIMIGEMATFDINLRDIVGGDVVGNDEID